MSVLAYRTGEGLGALGTCASLGNWKHLLLVAFSLIAEVKVCSATGLQTSYSNIYLQDVPLGVSTNVTATNGKMLVVKNIGDSAVLVAVQTLTPLPEQLREGALPLPDPHWVKLEPELIQIRPHSEGEIKVTLFVPAQSQYAGKHYQFMIWTHTEPDPSSGFSVTAGLLSRIRIRTANLR